ncbi:MAG: hypothetical protein R3F35_06530 [Myxococcota bacterium]
MCRLAVATFGGAILLGSPATASAEPSALEDPTHWVFSTALEAGIYGHTGKGNTHGSLITGPRIANPSVQEDLGPTVVPDLRSREEVLSALLGGTFEVMTPQLFEVASRPRLFMDVNISAALASEVGLARQFDPGKMGLPDNITAGTGVGEAAIVGRGTAITVQPQGPQIHAGLGVALAIELPDEVIRIKPSIVYSRTILDVKAVANRAVRLRAQSGAPSLENDFRLIQLADDFTEVYHGLGPALELEYEPGTRLGPLAMTLYIKGHASYLFGDLKTRMIGINPDYPDETVRWKYTQDRWAFRAATGIRLRWDPLWDR